MPKLPPNPTRDDILAALETVPENDRATRVKLMGMFAAAPPRPGIKMRHGARLGTAEVFEGGRWVGMKTASVIAAVLVLGSLTACDVLIPSKTFSAGGVTCSRGEAKIETDGEALKAAADSSIWQVFTNPSLDVDVDDLPMPEVLSAEDIKGLIASCKQFLD